MTEEEINYQCGDCSSYFRHKQDLLHHYKSSHSQESSRCECSLPSKRHLSRHVSRAHGTDEIFTCDFCKSSFKCRENLYRHIMDVHLEPEGGGSKCDFCGKIFKLKNSLKIHISVVHLETDESACWYCHKVFKRRADMKKHVRYVHNEVKNFECSLCNCRFAVKSTVTKHVIRHYRRSGFVLGREQVENVIVRL